MTRENRSEDESGESLIAWKSEVQLGTRQDGGPRLEELRHTTQELSPSPARMKRKETSKTFNTKLCLGVQSKRFGSQRILMVERPVTARNSSSCRSRRASSNISLVIICNKDASIQRCACRGLRLE